MISNQETAGEMKPVDTEKTAVLMSRECVVVDYVLSYPPNSLITFTTQQKSKSSLLRLNKFGK